MYKKKFVQWDHYFSSRSCLTLKIAIELIAYVNALSSNVMNNRASVFFVGTIWAWYLISDSGEVDNALQGQQRNIIDNIFMTHCVRSFIVIDYSIVYLSHNLMCCHWNCSANFFIINHIYPNRRRHIFKWKSKSKIK